MICAYPDILDLPGCSSCIISIWYPIIYSASDIENGQGTISESEFIVWCPISEFLKHNAGRVSIPNVGVCQQSRWPTNSLRPPSSSESLESSTCGRISKCSVTVAELLAEVPICALYSQTNFKLTAYSCSNDVWKCFAAHCMMIRVVSTDAAYLHAVGV